MEPVTPDVDVHKLFSSGPRRYPHTYAPPYHCQMTRDRTANVGPEKSDFVACSERDITTVRPRHAHCITWLTATVLMLGWNLYAMRRDIVVVVVPLVEFELLPTR